MTFADFGNQDLGPNEGLHRDADDTLAKKPQI